MSSDTKPPLLLMKNISKSFAGVPVLKDVSLEVRAGEVHILAGENGAGKSTLMKILAGIHSDYEGEIQLNGEKQRFGSPDEASAHGISMIHQEMSLIEGMSVLDNLFLGSEHCRAGIWLNRQSQVAQAQGLCEDLGLEIDLHARVEDYSMSIKNMIEIAKALLWDAKVLVMDEPTSALSEPEVDRLFERIDHLKKQGYGIIYISHRMKEIYRLADRITVLRDGQFIGSAPAAELSEDQLVTWLVGRSLNQQFPPRQTSFGPELLSLKAFSVHDPRGLRPYLVQNMNLNLRQGEILGFAGLQGAGNSDFFRGLFGVYGKHTSGEIKLEGQTLQLDSPQKAMAAGLAYVSNDRKGEGLVTGMSVEHNISLAALADLSPGGWLRPQKEQAVGEKAVKDLKIKVHRLGQAAATLSGGNQQKVVLAKWLEIKPKVLLLDEPTRGVDVGAKQEIYHLMNRLTEQGYALLLITSEMPELLAMSDRIMVMHRGHCTAEFNRDEASQEKILRAAMGEAA